MGKNKQNPHKQHSMRTIGLALAAISASALQLQAQDNHDLDAFCETCCEAAEKIMETAQELSNMDWEDWECDDCEDEECDDCDINYDSNGDGVWKDEDWYYEAW